MTAQTQAERFFAVRFGTTETLIRADSPEAARTEALGSLDAPEITYVGPCETVEFHSESEFEAAIEAAYGLSDATGDGGRT